MLTFNRKEITIAVPTGYKVTVTELVGKHQRILTEGRIPEEQRFEQLLIDIIKDVDGSDWQNKDLLGKKNILKLMAEGDKLRILTEARQLAKSHNPTYIYFYKYKTKTGASITKELKFTLIDAENLEETIETIEKMFKDKLTDRLKERIRELNVLGGFPCKPSLVEYATFKDFKEGADLIIDGLEIDEKMETYEFAFKLMNSRLEQSAKNIPFSTHKPLLERGLRVREKNTTDWKKVYSSDLDNFSIDAIDKIRNIVSLNEPAVDSLETFDAPDDHEKGVHEVQVNLLSNVNFFFPSINV